MVTNVTYAQNYLLLRSKLWTQGHIEIWPFFIKNGRFWLNRRPNHKNNYGNEILRVDYIYLDTLRANLNPPPPMGGGGAPRPLWGGEGKIFLNIHAYNH